jgi:hypothetical protein
MTMWPDEAEDGDDLTLWDRVEMGVIYKTPDEDETDDEVEFDDE